MAELEARKLRYPSTGSESYLLGVLIEGTSFVAKLLRANGLTLSGVKQGAMEILGRGDPFYFSPEHPDISNELAAAIQWAIDETERIGTKEVTAELVVAGIWANKESTGAKILASFGVTDDLIHVLKKRVAVAKL